MEEIEIISLIHIDMKKLNLRPCLVGQTRTLDPNANPAGQNLRPCLVGQTRTRESAEM